MRFSVLFLTLFIYFYNIVIRKKLLDDTRNNAKLQQLIVSASAYYVETPLRPLGYKNPLPLPGFT